MTIIWNVFLYTIPISYLQLSATQLEKLFDSEAKKLKPALTEKQRAAKREQIKTHQAILDRLKAELEIDP